MGDIDIEVVPHGTRAEAARPRIRESHVMAFGMPATWRRLASAGHHLGSEAVAHFDTKIAIVLDEQLAVWQKANVTAFLISGIAATDPALVGEPYVDGSGNRYLPMCRQPMMVYAAD